jgi:membrane protease subunit HflC
MNNKLISILVVILIASLILSMSVFTIDEKDQAIITQLGEYVRTVQEHGLHFKMPLVQQVHKLDARVLEYDAKSANIITSDKKHLVIDNYARWRIVDPLKFYQTVRTVSQAQPRLDDIVFSEIREELARHELTEIVSVNRAMIMEEVGKQCNAKAAAYGIEVIDVRIKRADLPEEVRHSVYARMQAERERIAKKYRSEGNEEAVKIRAGTDKEKVIILAESKRQAEKIRGEGDAEAIKIYALAYEKDPEFYEFVRTLEAYEKALAGETTVILPSNSEFFKFLGGGAAVDN